MADYQVDILIIGGGLNGAAMLRALAPTGLRMMLVDGHDYSKSQSDDADSRSLTLSTASMRILRGLGVWSEIESTVAPIHKIHVSEQGRFGTACLEGHAQDPLGYVIPIQDLVRVLYQTIDRQALLVPASVIAFDPEQRMATVQCGEKRYTVQAALFVAADGSQSSMRTLCQLPVTVKEYGQHALVTNLSLARAQQGIAYERFTTTGPLALLPTGHKRMGLVWSMLPTEAERLLALSDQEFIQHLTRVFGYRVGRIEHVGRRMTYPLRQMLMPDAVSGSVVFIGNAAHTLHPVAGQGFNLGLRDVAMLAQMITKIGLADPTLLAQYQAARQHDQKAIAHLTDGLITLYSHSNIGVKMARQFGVLILDNNRLLKRVLARYASGLAGIVPDLVCGIPV